MVKRNIKLTRNLKLWLYQNIRKFFKADPYFKHLNVDTMLSEFKYELREQIYLDDLLERLTSLGYNKEFKFFRKFKKDEILYFSYPDLCFQIESLFESWGDVVKIEREYTQVFENLYYSSQSSFIINDEYETAAEELETSQFIYGLRPNLKTYYKLDFDRVSLREYELSKVSSIKCDFKKEYDKFSKKIKHRTNIIAGETGNGLFFQTDIQSFYHSIAPIEVISFLKEFHPTAIGLIKSVQKLKKLGFKELPVGWILSSSIAYLILFRFHQNLKGSLQKKLLDLKVKNESFDNIEILSYVDDFVFLIETKRLLTKEEGESVAQEILKQASFEIQKSLKFKKVAFHKLSSEKSVLHNITPSFASVVDTNFFNFAGNDYGTDGWHALDEVMAPFDNDLILNERVQFFKILQSTKTKILEDDLDPDFLFDDIFNKVQYKLEKGGVKYLVSILSLLGQYFKHCNKKGLFNKALFEKYSKPLCLSLNEDKKNSINVWINFFEKLWEIIPDKQNREIVKSYKKMLDDCFNKQIKPRKELTIFDKDLFKSLKESQRKKNIIANYQDNEFNGNISEASSFRLCSILFRNINITRCMLEGVFDEVELRQRDLYSVIISMKEIFSLDNNKFSFFNIISHAQKNFSLLGRKKFISNIVAESSFYFFPRSGIEELKRIYNFFEENKLGNEGYAIELSFQLENFETISQFVSLDGQEKLDAYLISMQHYFTKKYENPLKGIVGDFDFYVLKKVLIKSFIWTNFLFLTSNVEDFWKILFFKYTSIDSALALNWSASPFSLNNASFVIGNFLKKIICLNYRLEIDEILAEIKKHLNTEKENFKITLNERVELINLDEVLHKFYDKEFDFSQGVKITIAPLKIPRESYDPKLGLAFRPECINEINSKVNGAISHAIKQKSNFIVFPEMSLPRKYLESYLKKAGEGGVILVGGVENMPDKFRFVSNDVVVSFPCSPFENPMGKYYWSFFQSKIFPSSKEYNILKKAKYNFKFGNKMVLFYSTKWNNFSILNCADFLSLELAYFLQGYVQTLIVPSMNYDSDTFNHLSNTYIRQLFCYCVISNNRAYGGSSILAPFRDKAKRNVFSIEGDSVPEFHTTKIYPEEISKIQNENYLKLFNDKDNSDEFIDKFKQLPPGWVKKIIIKK